MKKKSVFILLIIIASLTFVGGIELIVSRLKQRNIPPYLKYPSLRPQISRTISIRFDPSYYYNLHQRPKALAKELVRKWSDNGVNLVFYRAYDPRYGSFYRTKYKYNRMGDFGKYDLLSKVLKACHSHQIRIFAWFPVLNHAGAWERKPLWRTKTIGGSDYSVAGYEFPLNPESYEVQSWWHGFLSDFLNNYPEIDGVDFGEPVVSWGGKQRVTGKQTKALTRLLGDSTELVHKAQKSVCITITQTASPSGELVSFQELKKITGFDLLGVLRAKGSRTPDIVCPEFIWQEMRSRIGRDGSASVFNPAWVEKAVRQFMRWVEPRVEVIAHIELTDFPNVKVNAAHLKQAFQAAIQGGAGAVDVYSSHQLDIKKAWPVISEARNITSTKRCLVLFDQEGGKNDAIQIGELLRHFKTDVFLKSMDEYEPGIMKEYEFIFYLGTFSGASIPKAFLNDMFHDDIKLCWLGFNINVLLGRRNISKALGIEYIGAEKDRFNIVTYKKHSLPNKDPWMNVVRVSDPSRCQILATAKGGKTITPYALRSGRNFWYFANVPTSHAVEGGRFLVFADLLHDILNEDHISQHLAMVRIEDVHPLTNPDVLRKIAAFLHTQDVPFHVSLVPFYVFPEENLYVGLHEKPELVDAVRYMVKKGGVVVMHGTTHQRFGETATDYEFWDPVSDQPPEGENRAFIREKIEQGLRECWSVGIYPLMWETPHYAGSQELYEIVSDYFSIAMERRQAIDRVGTDQYLPYLIPHDRYGQIIVPENLGYVSLAKQEAGAILEPAQNMKVVRDGVASFFFHPFIDIHILKKIVKAMKKEGFKFTTINDLPIRVQTAFGLLINRSGSVTLSTKGFSGLEARGVFPGIMGESTRVRSNADNKYSQDITLRQGELHFVHFMGPKTKIFTRRTPADLEKTRDLLSTVSNFYGEQCKVPKPLLIEPFKISSEGKYESQALIALFKLVGIAVDRLNVLNFFNIPPSNNILLVPANAASSMTDAQVDNIITKLRSGDISLITSGFTALSDKIGIEKKNRELTVGPVRDNYYPDLKIQWNPSVLVSAFDAPANASFIYEDQNTGEPLLISSMLNQGRYLFLNLPYTNSSPLYSHRYPYLLTHIFRSMGIFPLIRRAAAEVYFNPAQREGIPIETLVKDWRRNGIRVVYAATWQVYPEWTYDYSHLIHLAHSSGILVYAWFELPHVNEKFWLDHPEWREKNALDEEAVVGWRKPMALAEKNCFNAVKKEMYTMLNRFDWDGIVLNRIGWESGRGVQDPDTFTPFHPAVRTHFKTKYGFNPLELLNPNSTYFWKTNRVSIDQFEQWRQQLAQKVLNELLAMLNTMQKKEKNSWEIIMTYDVGREQNGLTLRDMVSFKKRFDLSLQLASGIDQQWDGYTEPFDMVRIFLGPKEPRNQFYPGAPTSYPTGTALYALLGELIRNQKRFSIFSENSLFDVDRHMLPFLLATNSHWIWTGTGLNIQSPSSADILLAKPYALPMLIDNEPAGSFSKGLLVIPAGEHTISKGNFYHKLLSIGHSTARIVDCSADLLRATIKSLGLEITYRAHGRTVIVIDEKPLKVRVDGNKISIQPERGISGWALMLPRGEHTVTIHTRELSKLLLTVFSLIISNTIVVVSFFAIIGLTLLSITLIAIRNLKVKRRF